MADLPPLPDGATLDAPRTQQNLPPLPEGVTLDSQDASAKGIATPPGPSLGERFMTGAGSAGANVSAAALRVAGGIANIAGATDTADALMRKSDEASGKAKEIAQQGAGGGIAGMAAQTLGALPAGFVTLGAEQGINSGADIIQRGGSLSDAAPQVALDAVGSGVGAALGGLGKGVASRAVLQGAATGALGEGSRIAGNALRPDDQQQPFDPVQLGINIGAGVGLSELPHGSREAAPKTEAQPATGQPAAPIEAMPAKPAGPISAALDAGGVKAPEATQPEVAAAPAADVAPAKPSPAEAYAQRASDIDTLNTKRKSEGLSDDENTQLHDLRDQQDLANPVSGIPNRKAFDQAMSSGEYTHAVAMDIDGFKNINDTLGHGVGDLVLQKLGQRLNDASDGDMLFTHNSGDEYAAASKTDPTAKLTTLQNDLASKPFDISYLDSDGKEVQHTINGLGVTFGVGKDLHEADLASNASKEQRADSGLRRRREDQRPDDNAGRIQTTEGSATPVGEDGQRNGVQSPESREPSSGSESEKGVQPETVSTPVGDVAVDRSKDVPYLGGSSKDGKTVYLHKDLDPVIKDGPLAGLDRTVPLVTHEAVEAHYENLGHSYSDAHYNYAEPAEHQALLDQLGLKKGTPEADKAIEHYEASFPSDLKAAAEKNNPDVPPDLITKPYEHPHSEQQRKMLDEVEPAHNSVPSDAQHNLVRSNDEVTASRSDLPQSSRRGMPKAAIAEALKEPMSKLGDNTPKIAIHQTHDEAPPNLRRAIAGDRQIQGAYDSNTRSIHIFGDAIKTPREAVQVFTHEMIGHHGVEAVVGKDWPKLVSDINAMRATPPKAMKDVLAEVDRRYPGANADSFASETMAVLSERGIKNSIMDRVLAATRRFVRSLGVNAKFSDAELRQFLVAAKVHVESNRTPPPSSGGLAFSKGSPADAAPKAAEEKPSIADREKAAIPESVKQPLGDLVNDVLSKATPMATGSDAARAVAKDFANESRLARYEGSRTDEALKKGFDRAQQEKMWRAADEQSVLMQRGEDTKGKGLDTLTPEERAAVEKLQKDANDTFEQAKALGMVEGEGLPSYVPRMVVEMGVNGAKRVGASGNGPARDGSGGNVKTSSANLKERKYQTVEGTIAAAQKRFGGDADVVANIRTLPLATTKLKEALAGRRLINQIKEIGRAAGTDVVSEGAAPAGQAAKWFTLDHPAFQTWKPRMAADEHGNMTAVKDADGNTVFDKVPLYVHEDFKGPLKAVMSPAKAGAVYTALMSAKAKATSLIMFSPIIHNAVEWGRALPAMPGKVLSFRVYFDGNKARSDPATMREAINAGMSPIGGHGGTQDITGIADEPHIQAGRSLTAKAIGTLLDHTVSEKAGSAARELIDRAGDLWHNTLLWDRVADLQAGLYTNLRDSFIKKGMDPLAAQRVAAHMANRYAGSLPAEAMSTSARKIANLMLFSRSFTFGNLGAMKDALTGLPKDVQAQILRDSGELGRKTATDMARKKAIATVMLDVGLMYAGNSILQSSLAIMSGRSDLDKEEQGYARRLNGAIQKFKEDPTSIIHFASELSATADNEPNSQDRVLVGHAPDGTAIYMRNPTGKIGEEFSSWLTSPLNMLKRKEGTLARPIFQTITNDAGFGRKVYNPYAETPKEWLGNIGAIATNFMGSQLPVQSIAAAKNYFTGKGDATVNAGQAFGPFAGLTFSKGAPGGEAVGEMYAGKERHDYAVQKAMPDIRQQIQDGNVFAAKQAMNQLGMDPGYQSWIIKTTRNPSLRLSPSQMKQFKQYASPDELSRMQNARAH